MIVAYPGAGGRGPTLLRCEIEHSRIQSSHVTPLSSALLLSAQLSLVSSLRGRPASQVTHENKLIAAQPDAPAFHLRQRKSAFAIEIENLFGFGYLVRIAA